MVIGSNVSDWNPDHNQKQTIDGITIRDCDGVNLSDTIIENSFHGSKESGGTIEIERSRDVTVSHCQVLDPRYRGITITDSKRCKVMGCTAIDRRTPPAAAASIQVTGKSSDNLVSGNTVNKNSLAIGDGSARVEGTMEIEI